MSTRIVFATLLSAALLSSCSSPSDTGPAQGQQRIVSKDVGPFLIEAKAMADTKDYKGAMAKVDAAEAVKSMPDDNAVIAEMRYYLEFKMASLKPPQP